MFSFRKIFTVILFLSFILLILFHTKPSDAAPLQTDRSDEIIKLLDNAKTPEERLKILQDNKDSINSTIVDKLLVIFREPLERKKHLGQIAIEISEFIGDKELLARSFFHYSKFEFLEEKNYNPPGLEKALNLYKETGNRKGEAECYREQATNLSLIGKTEMAIETIDKALSIYDDLGDYYDTGDRECSYNQKATFYEDLGDTDKAIENLEKSIDISENRKDIELTVISYGTLAQVYKHNGFLEKAVNCFSRQRELIDKFKTGKHKEASLMYYYQDLGGLFNIMGNYEESIKNYNKSLELAKKLDNRSYMITNYHQLGTDYNLLGQRDIELKYYLQALAVESDLNNLITSYNFIGNFYLRIKKPEEAIKYFEIALEKSEKIENEEMRGFTKSYCIGSIGSVYEAKNETDPAIKKFEEALEIYEKLHKDYGVAEGCISSTYRQLADLYQKKGNKELTMEYMNKSLEFAEKTHIRDVISFSYKSMGDFYSEIEPAKAMDYYLKAIKLQEELHYPENLWKFYFSSGKLYEKEGDFKKAYEAYSNSIKIIENMRQELKVEEFKRDFMQNKIEVYEHMIELLIKTHREKDGFDYNEKARARAFLDILAQQKVDIHHGINPELSAKEDELKTRIQYLSDNIREEKEKPLNFQKSAFIRNTEDKIKNLKVEYQQVLEEIKLNNPEYMTLISVNPFSVEEIQSFLDKDTVILEYFLGKNKSFLWIIDKDSFHTVILNHTGNEIESLVRSYHEIACDNITAQKLDNPGWKDISGKLYRMIFKEGEGYISGKKRLIISPHRVLNYLPFQVLIDDKGKMLVEKYEIVYLPSASILKYCQDKNTLKKEKLLAFEPGNLKIGDFPPLPGSEDEVKAIAKYFPEKEIYSGSNMTTDILYKKGSEFDILHFATHGILDSSSPLFSSLVFSDRRLNVYEVFNLDLKSYLVCLSACRTGIGEEASGDELVGLSRAFIYAGTPAICSSLWDVSDISTSELMERFYYYLRDNNKSEALRLAQLDIMKKYPHPFFWAPFVLIGDWQ